MAPLPFGRILPSAVVLLWLLVQASGERTGAAAEVATNAISPPAPVLLAAKTEPSPPLAKNTPNTETSLASKPQPSPLAEPQTQLSQSTTAPVSILEWLMDDTDFSPPKVERVTVLPRIKPQLQEAPLLVLRPYLDTRP